MRRLRHLVSLCIPARYRPPLSVLDRNLRFRLHTYLGRFPAILFGAYRILGLYGHKKVTRETELVIEGFLRSASNFCYFALQHAQGRSVNIAWHIHLPAQVYRAARLGIPTLVLIRNPEEAVRSALVREPYISPAAFLERYRLFYTGLDRWREHYVVADFDDVVTDFGVVIDRINAKFGTSFRRFDHSPANLSAVYGLLEQKSELYGGGDAGSYLPNPRKESSKKQVDFARQRKAMQKCIALYNYYSPKKNPAVREG